MSSVVIETFGMPSACEGMDPPAWRGPQENHGCTRAGNFALIRTLGHPLGNNWTSDDVVIDREGGGIPVIPEELRSQRAASEYHGARY